MYRKCLVCGKEIHCYKSTYNKKKYCSKKCREKIEKIDSNCIFCNKEFSVAKSRYNSKYRRYKCCSKKCYNNLLEEEKKKRLEKNTNICDNCGKEFIRNINKNNILKFCSVECSRKYMRGINSPFYNGGCINSQGYKIITINGKQFYEHRIIIEDFTGRKLNYDEDVHHKDGNKLNNNVDNLEIINKGEHGRIHAYQRWNNIEERKEFNERD